MFGRFDLAALCGCRTFNFCLFVCNMADCSCGSSPFAPIAHCLEFMALVSIFSTVLIIVAAASLSSYSVLCVGVSVLLCLAGPPLTRSKRRRRRRNTRSTRKRRRSIKRRSGRGMTATAREKELMAMLKARQMVAVLRSLQGPPWLRMNEPDCWLVNASFAPIYIALCRLRLRGSSSVSLHESNVTSQ